VKICLDPLAVLFPQLDRIKDREGTYTVQVAVSTKPEESGWKRFVLKKDVMDQFRVTSESLDRSTFIGRGCFNKCWPNLHPSKEGSVYYVGFRKLRKKRGT
jgi:hypothetical protein